MENIAPHSDECQFSDNILIQHKKSLNKDKAKQFIFI